MRKFFAVRRGPPRPTQARGPGAISNDTPRQIKRRADELAGLAKSLDEAGLPDAADRVHEAIRLLDEVADMTSEVVKAQMRSP